MKNQKSFIPTTNIIWDSHYQIQAHYIKNIDLIKEKYKKWIKPLISIEQIHNNMKKPFVNW